MRNCIHCNVELIEEQNWSPSFVKTTIYICKACARETSKRWVRNNREQRMLINARNRAKNKGLDFDLELSDIVIPEYCPLLGIKILKAGDTGSSPVNNSPTLDRIDNSRGYVKGNVWVVSHLANSIMTSATYEQILWPVGSAVSLFL